MDSVWNPFKWMNEVNHSVRLNHRYKYMSFKSAQKKGWVRVIRDNDPSAGSPTERWVDLREKRDSLHYITHLLSHQRWARLYLRLSLFREGENPLLSSLWTLRPQAREWGHQRCGSSNLNSHCHLTYYFQSVVAIGRLSLHNLVVNWLSGLPRKRAV